MPLYNGTLNLISLIVEINNEVLPLDMLVVELTGSDCVFSTTNVVFRTKIKNNKLWRKFITGVRGSTISLTTT
jgi:hypothetical protein